jgi:hypothetical protein
MEIYRARNPHKSPLWQCTHRHYAEFRERYPEHYQPKQGPIRSVIEAGVHKFLDCRNLERRIVRIHCDSCGLDTLLAFSCKSRWFCPSCHQKKRPDFRRLYRRGRPRSGSSQALRPGTPQKCSVPISCGTGSFSNTSAPPHTRVSRSISERPSGRKRRIPQSSQYIPDKSAQMIRYYGWYSTTRCTGSVMWQQTEESQPSLCVLRPPHPHL